MLKQEILNGLTVRLTTVIDRRKATHWLWKEISKQENVINLEEVEGIYELVIGRVISSVVREVSFVSTAISIGETIMSKYNVTKEEHSKNALHCGVIVLEAFCNKDKKGGIRLFDIERIKMNNSSSHSQYMIRCVDSNLLEELIKIAGIAGLLEMPLVSKPVAWTSHYHPQLDGNLIRGAENATLKKMTPAFAPKVYAALNKLQDTAFLINQEVFTIYKHLIKTHTKEDLLKRDYKPQEVSPFKHEKEEMVASRIGMYIEAKYIADLANTIGERNFYHIYNCDFRGRIYPNTAYLHEQSSDNSKGLLRYEEAVPLGPVGDYWLAVHTANSIGEDKLTLDGRVAYVEDNMEEIISWAEDPLVNTGWMKTDKAWSTLACAFEWMHIRDWEVIGGNPRSEYCCNIPIFIDGSNNGVQHLTALSLDETIAPLVNLVPTETPGDVYMYVANRTWISIDKEQKLLEDAKSPILKEMPRLLKEIKKIKMKREVAVDKEERDSAFKELDTWRKANRELTRDIHIPFWHSISDKKIQRKIVKRPVMTLGYGVTDQGIRDQVFDDSKTLSEQLKFKDKSWSNNFADILNRTMRSSLKGPADMLDLFKKIAETFNDRNAQMQWLVPVTNFLVKHNYTRTKEDRVRIKFCGKGILASIQLAEESKLDKRKQVSSAAPNVVHSFDAAHLTLIVINSPFTVTTVHDSFGCHPGNMDDLFKITREQFISFYSTDPLINLLGQTGCEELAIERGTLNINEVLNSDFAFC